MPKYTNVKGYTDAQLLNKVSSLPNFKGFPKDYWILGVKSQEDEFNTFDDKFYLFKEKEFITVTTGTVNPGSVGLMNYERYNKKGTFVIKSDFWQYDLWKYGLHKRRMPALRQNTSVVGYRDYNKDNKSQEIGEEVKGWYGIHFHTISYSKKTGFWKKLIGGWSVGCQVVNNVEDYYKILGLVKDQESITYCMINEF